MVKATIFYTIEPASTDFLEVDLPNAIDIQNIIMNKRSLSYDISIHYIDDFLKELKRAKECFKNNENVICILQQLIYYCYNKKNVLNACIGKNIITN